MAQHQVGNLSHGFVDKQRSTSKSAAKSNGSVATPANYDNIAALDARLTAISATTYTQARLDTMSLNDKVYAVRLADDPNTL